MKERSRIDDESLRARAGIVYKPNKKTIRYTHSYMRGRVFPCSNKVAQQFCLNINGACRRTWTRVIPTDKTVK